MKQKLTKFLALSTLIAILSLGFPMMAQADVVDRITGGAASGVVGGVVGGPAGALAGGAVGSAVETVGETTTGAFVAAGGAVRDIAVGLYGLLDGDDNEDIVSFIGFEGGLQAPTGEGLDETLTRARTAREFIVNTVNFALSFLGVIAMAIVVYGGFLYITAAGNEEQSGKGKKAVTYAAVGILIIIVSFALVNTLLTFGGGSGEGERAGEGAGVRGAGQEGTNISQQSIYNLAAASVGASLNDFLGAYKNLLAVDTIVKGIRVMPAPGGDAANRSYVNQIKSSLTEIRNNTNSLSKVNIEAKNLLDGWVAETLALDLGNDDYDDGEIKEELDPLLDPLLDASREDFLATIDQIVGEDNSGGKLGLVQQILGEIVNTNANAVISRGFVTEKDIKRAFAGIDPNLTIREVLTDAIEALAASRRLAEDLSSNMLVASVIKSLDQLNIVVKNIEFVFVRIKASVVSGNAPLIVELNGLDSRDPTGDTVTDDRYEWDPVGASANELDVASLIFTGEASETLQGAYNAVECNTKQSATIICTYNQPGTYMVRLKIKSKDPARVATGQAFLPITVLPSVARISLKATVGGITEDLHKYEQDSLGRWRVTVDKREIQITSEEAKSPGINFDASESQAGGGATIRSFEWTFGDGSGMESTESVQHAYRQKGKFPLRLDVTDTGNRKDKKLLNVVIGSLAARTTVSKLEGEPEELIEVDGSLSRSDKGSISSYSWRILEVNPDDGSEKEITNLLDRVDTMSSLESSVLRMKFKNPGRYKIELTVNDGSEDAVHTDVILIKSRSPRANFTVASCPENCPDMATPSIVTVDASSTFDPDNNEILYEWKIFSEQGNELERGSSYTLMEGELQGAAAKKLRIKFKKTGKYKIQLTAKDNLPTELQRADVKEKEVEILSIVEARWNDRLENAMQLEDGEAIFELKGAVFNADRVQIDFGDGESNEQSVTLTRDLGNFEFTHSYDRAGSYLVELRALSEDGDGENTITKRLYVSGGDGPLAVIEVTMDDHEIVLPEPTTGNPNPALEIIRNKPVKFNGARSLDSRGNQEINLRYSWDFGDGERSTGVRVEHSYEDVSPEDSPYVVTLSISEVQNPTATAEATFPVNVISKKPQVNTLALEKITAGQVTPVDVKLTAEGANDLDGRITNYQFWYYSPANRERKLAVIDTQSDNAILTVETSGAEGEEHEYYFCVSVTDNENTKSACEEMFTQNELPVLRVTNGANKPPEVSFNADRTSVRIGEAVTFTSRSTDEDGRIAEYVWDVEGDGFQNNNPTALSTITYQYDRQSPQAGFRVKLKAIDNKGAAGYSQEIPIHVGSNSNPPLANFSYQVQSDPPRTVKFFDASTSDTNNGTRLVKWTWDFDTSKELGCTVQNPPAYCNGDKTDDEDSRDQNPTYRYDESGTHQVKLTVEDSDGNVSVPKTAMVNVIAGSSGGTGVPTPVSGTLRAELTTSPRFTYETIPGCANPAADECKKKIIRVPANSNGEDITLYWGDSTGDIVEYKIDKNTMCDSNGDTDRTNDVDRVHPDSSNPNSGQCVDAVRGAPAQNCWTTTYQRNARTDFNNLGRFITLLTVKDRNGNTDTDEVEVIFGGEIDENAVRNNRCDGTPQSSPLGASLFKDLGAQNIILIGLVTGAIVILMVFGAANFVLPGHKR